MQKESEVMGMCQVSLDEAQKRLPDLVNAAIKGENVFIFKEKEEIVQLVPIKPAKRNPQFGSAKGLIEMSADFDAPLPDFYESVSADAEFDAYGIERLW